MPTQHDPAHMQSATHPHIGTRARPCNPTPMGGGKRPGVSVTGQPARGGANLVTIQTGWHSQMFGST